MFFRNCNHKDFLCRNVRFLRFYNIQNNKNTYFEKSKKGIFCFYMKKNCNFAFVKMHKSKKCCNFNSLTSSVL